MIFDISLAWSQHLCRTWGQQQTRDPLWFIHHRVFKGFLDEKWPYCFVMFIILQSNSLKQLVALWPTYYFLTAITQV